MRAQVLQRCFQLLYGPLVFLHEPAGRLLMGVAWDERRLTLLADLDSDAQVLELGCGEGRLLSLAQARGTAAVGIDISSAMLQRARGRADHVVQADARRLPFADGTFKRVVASYPGPWIFDVQTQREIARVCRPDARIVVLLGGDYQRGSGHRLRRLLAFAAYGGSAIDMRATALEQRLDCSDLDGTVQVRQDDWGHALVLVAVPGSGGAPAL